MINTLIFDFGDVFINLDKEGAIENALKLFKLKAFDNDMIKINEKFEVGLIDTEEFLSYYLNRFPNCSRDDILNAWNFILRDFPEYRLDFLKKVKESNRYKLILLSNTNTLHIDWIIENVSYYNDFKNCFDSFYLSHEIGFRKPNSDIFKFIIEENSLSPQYCLFIDDTKENTKAAVELGFHTWNIDEQTEDVIELFQTKRLLF